MKKPNSLRQNEDFYEEVGDPLFVLEERKEELMERNPAACESSSSIGLFF